MVTQAGLMHLRELQGHARHSSQRCWCTAAVHHSCSRCVDARPTPAARVPPAPPSPPAPACSPAAAPVHVPPLLGLPRSVKNREGGRIGGKRRVTLQTRRRPGWVTCRVKRKRSCRGLTRRRRRRGRAPHQPPHCTGIASGAPKPGTSAPSLMSWRMLAGTTVRRRTSGVALPASSERPAQSSAALLWGLPSMEMQTRCDCWGGAMACPRQAVTRHSGLVGGAPLHESRGAVPRQRRRLVCPLNSSAYRKFVRRSLNTYQSA